MNPAIATGIFELIKNGIKALIENIDFTGKNSSSVNIEQRMNEMLGDVYALEGYAEKMNNELNETKVKALNFENRAISAELKVDQLENKVKELQHEIDELNKYFKGE